VFYISSKGTVKKSTFSLANSNASVGNLGNNIDKAGESEIMIGEADENTSKELTYY
jgi:hypothetical protein